MSYLNLLKWVGVKSFTQELFFPLPPETVSQAEEFWQKFNLKDELTIGLNPGSVYGEARRWPLEYFIKLGEKLIKELRARIIIFGSYHELELGEKIESTLPVVNMIGKTSLPFLGALLQKCNVLVTNDSGIMHVAAAVNCQKIVALFGPGDPKVTAPYTKRCIILKKTLPCSPCSYRKCPRRHPCLKGITVEEVFQKVVSSNFSQLG
jgi:heptosyltransferase-2